MPAICRITIFTIRFTAIFALGMRGDASAIPALEAMLNSKNLSIEMEPMIKEQIERLKNPMARSGGHHGAGQPEMNAAAKPEDDQRLARLEQLVQEMNDRLKEIEKRLAAGTEAVISTAPPAGCAGRAGCCRWVR